MSAHRIALPAVALLLLVLPAAAQMSGRSDRTGAGRLQGRASPMATPRGNLERRVPGLAEPSTRLEPRLPGTVEPATRSDRIGVGTIQDRTSQVPTPQTSGTPERRLPDAAAPPAPSEQTIPPDGDRGQIPAPRHPTRKGSSGSATGATGATTPFNPNADLSSCENRAQASAGILDLVDKITAGIVSGSLRAEAASAGMKQLVVASGRLDKEDVRGACAIVRSVRNRYRFARKG